MKRIIDMSPEEVQANYKRIDHETKLEMREVIKLIKSQYLSYSEEAKKLVTKILKM